VKKMIVKTAVVATAGLSVLMSTGCSSGPDSATASRTSLAAPSATSGGTPGYAVAQGRATNLIVTPELRRLLGDAFYQATRREPGDGASGDRRAKVIGPEQVFYGKIAGMESSQDVFYAMGDTGYSDDPISQQDGPHVWRRRGGGWEYLGDTGGDFCGKIPQALVRAWGKSCP
jgi:hypothetical protein